MQLSICVMACEVCFPPPATRVVIHCRIIMSKPQLAIMDEATSALDTTNEELLYKALKSIGVTFVSVGHRPTLTAYHEQQLKLQPVSNVKEVEGVQWRVDALSEKAES